MSLWILDTDHYQPTKLNHQKLMDQIPSFSRTSSKLIPS